MNPAFAPEALVFVDLETSGANFANDRIIEVGLVEVDSQGAREWSALVNPEAPVSSFITGLTGINDAMLSSAPTFAQLAPSLLQRLRGRLLIAHNARFDYGFLRCEFKRLGIEFRAPTLCTVKLSRKLFPQHHRHNLDTLVTRHGLAVAGSRHRALADARLLWDLWRCWHGQLPVETIRSVVANLVGRPELPAQIDPALM
jgi:DNA polymerase-3 subunit epsilon